MISKNCLSIMALAAILFNSACSTAAVNRNVSSAHSAPQIYAFESDANGFNTKTFFYDNGEEIVAFDSQFTPETAKQSIAYLRTKTQNPITYVVITHPNPDKFNGMSAFQVLGAKVIASKATALKMPAVHAYKQYYFVNISKMFTAESYPALSLPDILFEQNYALKLRNGECINLQELSAPGVNTNQTVASIPAINALIVGDLIHHKAHAWLEGGIVDGKPSPNLKGWIADLAEIATQFRAENPVVYGGRGEAVSLNLAVRDQVEYLQKADALVSVYVESLDTRKAELSGADAGKHYATLQNLFEKEFPDYSLGYMIQYGIYGLVDSKLP